MMLVSCSRRVCLFATIVAATAALSGCSVMESTGSKSLELPGEAAAVPGEAASQTPASITMEVRPAGKKAELGRVPLDGPTTIQQVLQRARLVKRFRRMDICLMRVARAERHKLEVKYDHTEGMVDPLYDYALHPGDHLLVTENTTTMFDEMLGSLTAPLIPSSRR
jgi:hypothetical protein